MNDKTKSILDEIEGNFKIVYHNASSENNNDACGCYLDESYFYIIQCICVRTGEIVLEEFFDNEILAVKKMHDLPDDGVIMHRLIERKITDKEVKI